MHVAVIREYSFTDLRLTFQCQNGAASVVVMASPGSGASAPLTRADLLEIDTAPNDIYTLSLHDALPISVRDLLR